MADRRPDEPRRRHEAATWFTRLRRPAISTDELRRFRDWRASPPNAAAFEEVDTVWRAAGALETDPDILAAVAAVKPRRRRLDTGRLADLLRPAALLGAGALAALLVILGVSLYGQWRPTYETGIGEQRSLTLSDGSRVRLNTDTRLAVRFTGGQRRLLLQRGQAFFDAARDPARPFVVEAGGAQVRALGTRFDVRRDGDLVRVVLAEGRVTVAPDDGGRGAVLAPGQAVVASATTVSAPAAADAQQLTSWTTGRIVFSDTTVGEAVREMNRYARRPLTLAAPAVAEERISGVFDAGDAEALAAALALRFDLTAQPSEDGTRLVPRGTQGG